MRILSHLLHTESSIIAGLGGITVVESIVYFDNGTLSFPLALAGVVGGCALSLYEWLLYKENNSRH